MLGKRPALQAAGNVLIVKPLEVIAVEVGVLDAAQVYSIANKKRMVHTPTTFQAARPARIAPLRADPGAGTRRYRHCVPIISVSTPLPLQPRPQGTEPEQPIFGYRLPGTPERGISLRTGA